MLNDLDVFYPNYFHIDFRSVVLILQPLHDPQSVLICILKLSDGFFESKIVT